MSKRILYTAILFIVLKTSVNGQETIVNQVNTPLLEKYIELAKQNYPRTKIFEENIVAAKSRISNASMGYLEALNLSYIYRPYQQAAISVENPYSVNGFQFGLHLNIGTFLKTPSLVKQSKQAYKVALLEEKEFNITLATQVKTKYLEYIHAIGNLKVRAQAYDDYRTSNNSLKYRFEKGEVGLDVYNSAKIALSDANTEKLAAELNLLKAKVALEDLIGDKLENIKL